MVSGTATANPSSHMAAKKPRIQAIMPRVLCLASADCPFVLGLSMPARLDLTRLATSDLSCRSASASPANPIAHGNRRARNHHSRASHRVQAKNATTTKVKIGAHNEITGSLFNEITAAVSGHVALCLFRFLRHLWKIG